MEGTAAPIDAFNAHMALGDDEWEGFPDSWTNADCSDANAASNKFWRRKTAHAISTAFVLKFDTIFPNIEPDVLCEMFSNFETRMKWDERIVSGKLVERPADGSTVFHHYTPKPPIPVISQRELLLQMWTFKEFQPGTTLVIRPLSNPSVQN